MSCSRRNSDDLMRRIEKFPRIIDSITKFNFSQGGRPLKNVINANEIITFGEFSKNSFTSSIGFQNIFIEQGICKKYDLFITLKLVACPFTG